MTALLKPELRPTTITPRSFQVEAMRKVFGRFRANDRSTLVVLPTGVGKTNLGGMIIRAGCEAGRKSLWLTHRTDLATQTINALERHGLDPQREQAGEYARALMGEPDVVVATVQSLAGRRLAQWPRDYFNLIVADEAHHYVGDSYKQALSYFDRARIMGLTATPDRADGANLGETFESVADERDIFWAWSDPEGPYLCPLRIVRRDVGFDIGRLRIDRAGDYAADDLAELLNPLVERVANVILDEVGERRTLAYVPRVVTAQALATALQSLGMDADWVAGNDPDRVAKLERFAAGNLQVLVNADLLGEGNDLPQVGCVVDAYPTRSRSRFVQRLGRGLRADTEDCLLICLASNSKDHQLRTPADLIPQARFNPAIADWLDTLIEQQERPIELMDALEQARDLEERHPEPPRVVRCRARRYIVSGRRVELDPMAAAEVMGCPADFRIARPVQMARYDRLSPKQFALLDRSGVRDAQRLSRRQASVLIGRIVERRDAGLATIPQIHTMIGRGIDPELARAMSFDEAREALDHLIGRKN